MQNTKSHTAIILGSALQSTLNRWSPLLRAIAVLCLIAGLLQSTGSRTALAQQTETGILHVQVLDAKGGPLAAALVKLFTLDGQKVVAERYTSSQGEIKLIGLAPDHYQLQVEAEGYEPFTEQDIDVQAGTMAEISLQLTEKVTLSDTVTVKAQPDTLIEQGSAPQAQLNQQVLKTVPLQSRDFDQALPIVPGVIRAPDGKISIKGGRENQSALLINEADATDPATGNFALSIPLESIEQVRIYTNPYLPEYGKFTGGVTKVETRRGGEKWKLELDDLFPEPRFRGGTLFGFANFSPRIHLEGPIIKNRFYLAQGLEYDIDKKPVRGLASPNNEIKKVVARSFTQLDYIVSPRQTLTLTFNYSPRRIEHVGLDFFNPQPVAPNQRATDTTLGIADRLSLPGGSFLETIFQYKRIGASVYSAGSDPMVFTPLGREGNYFHHEDRATERWQLRVTDTLPTISANGIHNVKFGVDTNYLRNDGRDQNQTVIIKRADNTVAQQIQYFTAGSLRATNPEVAAFAQDQWLIRRNLSFDFGLRMEAQRATAGISLMPRMAVSYSPGTSGAMVFRAAYGLFYDRIPLNALSFVNAPPPTVTTFGPDGTTIVDGPRLFQYLLAPRPDGQPNRGNDFAAPRNQTFSFEFDRRLMANALLKIAYLESRTQHDFYVSPVFGLDRSAIFLFNNGRGLYRSLEVTTSFKLSDERSLDVSYIRSRARGELNDFVSYFGDFPEPILRPNQFSNLPSDAPNRLLVRGNFNKLPYGLSIAPLLDFHTGFPYSIRDENQDFVGIRNSGGTRFPRFFSLDMAITKDVRVLDKYKAQFTFSLFNATDHFNPRNIKANIDDPGFGTFFASYRRFYRIDFAFIW